MISFLGIWEKILGVAALIGGAAAAVFYFLFRIQKGKVDRLENDVENLEDDLDESIRINEDNRKAWEEERRHDDMVDDFEDKADNIGRDGYNRIDPDDLPDDEIVFGEDE